MIISALLLLSFGVAAGSKDKVIHGLSPEIQTAKSNIFEGDIAVENDADAAVIDYVYNDVWNQKLLGPKPAITADGPRGRSLAAINTAVKKWKDNTMIYELEDDLPAITRKLVWNAMREIEANTCYKFRKRTNEWFGYTRIVKHKSLCMANVGAPRYGTHTVWLKTSNNAASKGCTYPTVLHELIHALGAFHTQGRSDRNKHVTINWHNIKSGQVNQFTKQVHSFFPQNKKGKEYDYWSIMHYKKNAFSANGKITIDAGSKNSVIGKADRLSERDVIQLSEWAGCPVPKKILSKGDNGKVKGLSYARGAGRIPTGGCEPDASLSAGLCYPKCRKGYKASGPVCWQSCGGFGRDDGAFCAKPKPYGRGAGRSPCTGCSGCSWRGCSGCSSCSTKHCRKKEQVHGALCYPKCRDGYKAFLCCICSPICPSGMSDIGVSCAKHSYGRVKRRSCKEGEVYDAGLCYKPCKPYIIEALDPFAGGHREMDYGRTTPTSLNRIK